MEKNFAGKNGFTWFTGIVESRYDPLKLGRCKVRMAGWHSDNKMEASTDSLPWATPLSPVNNTNSYTPKEGSMVVGFFLDGEAGQHPVILGVLPSIPLQSPNSQRGFTDDRTPSQLENSPRFPQNKTYSVDGSGVSIVELPSASHYPLNLDEPTSPRLARNDASTIGDTFIQERKNNVVTGILAVNSTWSEPVTEYGAKYPYNNVTESESGHIQELDDTPGHERIHEAHRSGTFYEVYPNGSKVSKVVKDNYRIVMTDDHVYIMGKCLITVQGDAEIYVKKDAYMKVDGNFDVKVGKNFTVEVGSNYTVTVANEYNVTSIGSYTINAGNGFSLNTKGDSTITSSGNSVTNTTGDTTVNSTGSIINRASLMELTAADNFNINAGSIFTVSAPEIDI